MSLVAFIISASHEKLHSSKIDTAPYTHIRRSIYVDHVTFFALLSLSIYVYVYIYIKREREMRSGTIPLLVMWLRRKFLRL